MIIKLKDFRSTQKNPQRIRALFQSDTTSYAG